MLEKWIKKYFKEQWVEVTTDIDFSKIDPISTANSLHIYEERYEINDDEYRLLYTIGDKTNTPIIEKLEKTKL